jgi:peptidoglycan/xylan/chitin deacetylase (PgdA/CDA1 family)
MYHYVRDLARSRYPAIKGRDVAEFRRQLDHFAQKYNVVTMEQVFEAVDGGEPLPPDAMLLTFDDGYIDHYVAAFPLLHDRGWQGSFFPVAMSSRDGLLLDINRVHFILAAQPDTSLLVQAIEAFMREHQGAEGLVTFEEMWQRNAHASRLDTAEVIFIKRALQRDLPRPLRTSLANLLFERFVSVDPGAFANELYMNADCLRTMIRCGMYVGVHGHTHQWMTTLNEDERRVELSESLSFLAQIGAPTDRWAMSWPLGSYDAVLQQAVQSKGCSVAFSTVVARACLAKDHRLALPRLDTNDFPV